MLDDKDLVDRITHVKNLKEGCFKYLEASSEELLTHKTIISIAKLSSEKMGPVKLAEIAEDVFGTGDKSKQDLVRVTIERSLMKCGIVEKLRYSTIDVRYILAAYRFQKVKEIDSFRGDRSEPIGKIFELPHSSWPIPDEYFILLSQKFGDDEVLKKINSDFDKGLIPRGKYEDLTREFTEHLSQISKKLSSQFGGLHDLVV